MSSTIHGLSSGYVSHLRHVFAERERNIRERVRKNQAPHIEFLEKRGLSLDNLREFSGKHIAAGALAAGMVFSPFAGVSTPTVSHQTNFAAQSASAVFVEDKNAVMAQQLKQIVPAGWDNLTPAQEQQVTTVIQNDLHVKATAELDGHRLNRSFGLIGAEQHLYRYPGDNIFDQLQTPSDFAMYGGSGIAPGLGAYGYWARSKDQLTPAMEEQEKWYVVAQTFLAPGFKEDPRGTVEFYKYRKFIVINPDTGQAVVGDLADAGPSEYTGKSFGGSPEVMNYLGYGGGPRKGRVIFYFLDDPQNKIPLGPVTGPIGAK